MGINAMDQPRFPDFHTGTDACTRDAAINGCKMV
jgi:hypothetical protein